MRTRKQAIHRCFACTVPLEPQERTAGICEYCQWLRKQDALVADLFYPEEATYAKRDPRQAT